MPTAKTSSIGTARAAAFHEDRTLYGLRATLSCRQDYIPQSRAVHRQHSAVQVREAQPEELLAAIFMLTTRSEATSTAVNVERLRATDSKGFAISG